MMGKFSIETLAFMVAIALTASVLTALVLLQVLRPPPRIIMVDTHALAREYTIQLARGARATNMDEAAITQAAQQWADDLEALLIRIASDNHVVIVPSAIGAPDWSDDIRARLRSPVDGKAREDKR